MQSGFPPRTQWEGRASLGVILLEEDTQELPQELAPQSPTGAVHISGKCTKPISSGITFQLKDPVLIAFCPPSPQPPLPPWSCVEQVQRLLWCCWRWSVQSSAAGQANQQLIPFVADVRQ